MTADRKALAAAYVVMFVGLAAVVIGAAPLSLARFALVLLGVFLVALAIGVASFSDWLKRHNVR